jgi:hypothetical protein
MLKSIDILLGVAVVMLVFSAMVTIITQFVINTWNMKGRHLRTGLADLLEQISPGIAREAADDIARMVLLHPLIREGKSKLGAVVHRDELTALLLELAQGGGTKKMAPLSHEALIRALQNNGIENPGLVLDKVRAVSLQIEQANPDLSNSMRQNMALLREANSAFLAKLNGWFDQTIDRVTDRFTLNTRYVTFFCAAAVAFAIQLDTLALVNRLSMDPKLREALVAVADEAAKAPPPAPAQAEAGTLQLTEAKREALLKFEELNLITFPRDFEKWRENWSNANILTVVGILLSSILLSLGAPFWYGALTNLLRLRGVLTRKEEKDRNERQTTQTQTTGTAAAVIGTGNLG